MRRVTQVPVLSFYFQEFVCGSAGPSYISVTTSPRRDKTAICARCRQRQLCRNREGGLAAGGHRWTHEVRAAQYDWDSVARFVVGAFRVDAARAGAAAEAEPLVDELCRLSPEFKAMWQDNDVRSHGEVGKYIRHAVLGLMVRGYGGAS